MKPGYLITFEGCEGGGKTSQISALAEVLQQRGLEVVKTFEPGGGNQLTHRIREMILNSDFHDMCEETELFLMLAARVEHVKQLILPALCQGKVVLCDRFVDSSVAYQGYGRGLPIKVVDEMNRFAIRGRRPDLTFILDLPPEIGLQRAAQKRGLDRIERESLTFHQRVREGFLQLAAEGEHYFVIDANRKFEEVQKEILDKVMKVVSL